MGDDPIPPAVESALGAWAAQGRPPQGAIKWHLEKWIAERNGQPRYPNVYELRTFLTELPNPIARADVQRCGATAAESDDDALRAFVASMVWGYGPTGYGPFRTNRILGVNPSTSEKLRIVAEAAVRDGPVASYKALANDQRLKWLGPAFGTKYLAFVSPDDRPALILDAFIATWLQANGGPAFDAGRWSTQTYSRYVETLESWASGRCTASELEAVLFTAAQRERLARRPNTRRKRSR